MSVMGVFCCELVNNACHRMAAGDFSDVLYWWD